VRRTVTRLRERERELDALEALSGALAAGRGQTLLVEGPAGIGKTALLAALRERGERDGARVLHARGGELESDDQFGIVRQLFGDPLSAAQLGELPEAAEAALGRGDATVAPPGEDAAHAANHALYAVCARLAGERSLLVLVDDAHWADARSLRWLLFLERRIGRGAPVALALALRAGETGDSKRVLDRIALDEQARTLRPEPFSPAATNDLVREALGADAAPEFCEACQRATGGNPFLLRELLVELQESGVPATADAAELALSVGPDSVARATLLRLSRAPAAALALARALAVLEEAGVGEAAALAQIDPSVADTAASALARAGLLAAGPRLRFAHPLVRSAIYRELDDQGRASSHRMAAAVLRTSGAPAEKIAAHLMLGGATGDATAVASLRAAARRAYASGAPDAAAAYLRRALAEPPEPAARAEVLFELGRTEVRASEPDAVAHLEDACATLPAGEARARARRELGRAHMRNGRMNEATVTFEAAAGDATGDRELMLAVEGELAAALANVAGAAQAQRRLAPYAELPGETPAERAVLAVLAFSSIQQNRPASIAAELMDRALRGEQLLGEQTASTVVFADALFALILAGREERALACLQVAERQSYELGWTIGLSATPFYQAWAELRLGRLREGRSHALASLAVSDERGWQAFTPMAAATLCEAELELGDAAAAAAALDRAGLPEEVPDSALFQLALYARGLIRAHQGDAAGALADLLLCGQREVGLGGITPAAMAWRSHAALLYAGIGEPREAVALAQEEADLARTLGTPRAIAISLRALGIVQGGAGGLAALGDAADAVAGGEAPLERARALCDLGAAARRANRRRAAREPLREALALAVELGARPLAERARLELLAAGGRPRRAALSGPDALTASESRVARLAAAGETNRQIAAELVVSVRTIEFHLSRAYAKLGISSRGELESALAGEEVADQRG
jgi:DNA-binding CsgD family transcriptional regulator